MVEETEELFSMHQKSNSYYCLLKGGEIIKVSTCEENLIGKEISCHSTWGQFLS